MSKCVTIREISKILGLSHTTVSAVLNNKSYCYASAETKGRIVETARRLGYRPNAAALTLRGKPSGLIGVISSIGFASIHVDLLSEINGCIWKSGRHVILGDSRFHKENEAELVREFLSRGVDGLIIHNVNEKAELASLIGGRVPFILVNGEYGQSDFTVDRRLGASLAVEHLVGHGHKRIGMLGAQLSYSKEKIEGFESSLRRSGLPVDASLIIEASALKADWEGKVEKLVRGGTTAFFTTNDELALRLARHLAELGLQVPKDVAIIGFDSLPFCKFSMPSISSLRQPVDRLAEAAMNALLEMMEKGESVRNAPTVRFPPELEIRNSCGCKAGARKKGEMARC